MEISFPGEVYQTSRSNFKSKCTICCKTCIYKEYRGYKKRTPHRKCWGVLISTGGSPDGLGWTYVRQL